MDISWGSKEAHKFATNVGLVTSNGPHGQNIMAAEWTHQISYSPGLVMINVGFDKATEVNIKKTKEFGVSIAADDQNIISSIAGGFSGKNVDKIKMLEDMGFEFYKAKKIDVLMVKGAAMNAEFKLIKAEKMGDHMAFIGEAVALGTSDKSPIIYSGGKYWALDKQVEKPFQDVLDKIKRLAEKYKK